MSRWDRMQKAAAIKPDEPHAWIQWKGTNVCMDVYCVCGAHGHIDEEFAYHYRCLKCGRYFDVDGHVRLVEVPKDELDDNDHRGVCTVEDANTSRPDDEDDHTGGRGAPMREPPHDARGVLKWKGEPALRPHTIPGWWQVWSGSICIALLRPEDVAPLTSQADEGSKSPHWLPKYSKKSS